MRYGPYVGEKIKRSWEGEILSIPDFWIISTDDYYTDTYRRDEVDLKDVTIMRRLVNYPEKIIHCDQTPGEVVIAGDNMVRLWRVINNDIIVIPIEEGVVGSVRGVFFINADVYITKGKSIFHYAM